MTLTRPFNIDDNEAPWRCPTCGRELDPDHDARMARLYVEGLERWDGLAPADQTGREGVNL